MIDKRAAGNAAVIVVCPGKPASTLWHSSAVYHADTSHRSCDCPLNKERPVDLRVVAATHRDLRGMLDGQHFREDLYYRLSEVTVRIPPLRERTGDAILLAKYFLRESVRRHGSRVRGLAPDAIEAIRRYAWPGNVRELENRVKTAVIMCDGPTISAADLSLGEVAEQGPHLNLREVRTRAERLAVRQAMALAENNISRASELLGITRPTLYDLLEKLGLSDAGDARRASDGCGGPRTFKRRAAAVCFGLL